MAVPKEDSFRLVSDYKAVNEQVEKSPVVMANQEADIVDLLSARFFGKLDLLQGYRQMPLAEEARETFTITTPLGLFPALKSLAKRNEFFPAPASPDWTTPPAGSGTRTRTPTAPPRTTTTNSSSRDRTASAWSSPRTPQVSAGHAWATRAQRGHPAALDETR